MSRAVHDAGKAVGVVVLVAVVLFVATGVWPPLVAVESGSMAPNLVKGDLVVVSATARYPGPGADAAGVVTAARATKTGYRRLGGAGDVVVFVSPEREGSPIIHRARFHVDAGENWYRRANESYLPSSVDNCAELRHCPAPHAGYITKGDHNDWYDQATTTASPVRPAWVRAKAQVRAPLLGWIRLVVEGKV